MVKSGNDQEIMQSERNSPLQKPDRNNLIDNKVSILEEHIVSSVRSFLPIGGHAITRH